MVKQHNTGKRIKRAFRILKAGKQAGLQQLACGVVVA